MPQGLHSILGGVEFLFSTYTNLHLVKSNLILLFSAQCYMSGFLYIILNMAGTVLFFEVNSINKLFSLSCRLARNTTHLWDTPVVASIILMFDHPLYEL